MRVFQASIEQMLWPEKREHDPALGNRTPAIRSMHRSHDGAKLISMPRGYVPDVAASAGGQAAAGSLPCAVRRDGGITIGPFPKGLPVNLLSNLQPLPESKDPMRGPRHVERLLRLLVDLKLYLATLPADATDEQMVSGIADRMGPRCWR